MRTAKTLLWVIVLIGSAAVSSFAQQEFIFTTTPANASGPRALIDMPGLTGNPLAIIVATPLGETEMLNPHPIGVWYIGGKWYLCNVDIGVMPPGAKYRIQFFQRPGPNNFLHNVTNKNLGAEGSYIDSPALNNNPNAQVLILQNHAPEVRSPFALNQGNAKASYSSAAGRWYIYNADEKTLPVGSAFNVVVGSGSGGGDLPNPNPTNPNPTNPNPANPNPTNPNPTNPNPTNPNPTNPNSTNPNPTIPNPNTGNPTSPQRPIGRAPVDKTDRPIPTSPLPTPTPLKGWVDMHTHPMSHLGFGKRLMYGAPDAEMIVPAGTRNCNPTDFRARDIVDALGNCNSAHGPWDPLNNPCGDTLRSAVLSSMFDDEFTYNYGNNPFQGGNLLGDHRHEGVGTSPPFLYFPNQTSKIHQQMWWEWIKRAKEMGNLRVMVALAVNSELLAEILNGESPKDDKESADLQIYEMKLFVGRHPDFMEIAYTAADLRRIVGEGKLAVILGMEVDNIGNFNRQNSLGDAQIKAEIQRLYDQGIRYAFPIHLVNNKFGGSAIYEDLFNFSNKYSTGEFYKVTSSNAVSYRLGVMSDVGVFLSASKNFIPILQGLSALPYPPATTNLDPTSPNFCPVPVLACWRTFKILNGIVNPQFSNYQIYDRIPNGHVNSLGLTENGKVAIKEMMRLGMMIDIDHMGDMAQNDTLNLAEPVDYPVNIGHNGVRKQNGSERHASLNSIERVAKLGGVFGVGTADSNKHNQDANTFITSFNEVWAAMGAKGGTPRVAMGTDANGMERLPRASKGLDASTFYTASFPRAQTLSRTWNYTFEGVAHYGLMADFIKDVGERNASVRDRLMDSAEYFAQMWEKAERQKLTVK